MKLAVVTIAASACLGCAWEPGHGFATLESASVVATFEPEPSDPAITVSSLEIDVSAVDLEGSGPEPAQEDEHAHGEEAEAAAEEAVEASVSAGDSEESDEAPAETPADDTVASAVDEAPASAVASNGEDAAAETE